MSPVRTPEDGFARLNDAGEWDLSLAPRAGVFPAARPRRPVVRWSVGIVATAAVAAIALAVGFGIRDLRGGTPPAVAPTTTATATASPTPTPTSPPTTAPPASTAPTLSLDGLGPLRLGEPVPADNGIVELTTLSCGTQSWQSVSPSGNLGLGLSVATTDFTDPSSDISSILLANDTYTTSWGVGMGATEAELRSAVPDATPESASSTTVYVVTNGTNDVLFFVPTEAVYVWTPAEVGHVARIKLVPHGVEENLDAAGQDGMPTCD